MTDLGDPQAVKARNKQTMRSAAERKEMLGAVMGLKQGRELIAEWLGWAHVNASSFTRDPIQTAFNEGERNIGLRILADVTAATPELYALMLKERGEKDVVEQTVVEGSRNGGDSESDTDASGESAAGRSGPAYTGGPGPQPT